jgi:hypothetical protein
MEKTNLLKLLELEMKEEQYYLAVFQKEVTFFWGAISAIIVAYSSRITRGAFRIKHL